MIDIEQIEAIAKAAPQGAWQVWTSNSWRRVYANDKPAITPCVQRHDNHPDLMFAPGVKEWLEGVTPAAVLELVAEVRRLRDGEPNMRHPKIQALLSAQARYRYELAIIDDLISDPAYEYTGTDCDYQTDLTDKVEAFVKAAHQDKESLEREAAREKEKA